MAHFSLSTINQQSILKTTTLAKVGQDNSELKLKESDLFTPGKYLIADSGFPVETNVKRFNHHLSSIRVCNEHCIGILKGRFQSLRGLRKDLSSAATMEKITHWISTCVILHNFLLSDKSPDYEADVDDEDSEQNGAQHGRSEHGNQLREQVCAEVIEFLDL
ncbi:hypothetical protein H4Q26_008452 [Puccinia striiformis f. sp. tritici PST-130]|nr:hypothetical protein H4Q26_008452 [Puccinia striiformis f. sp. tritici PST-130]